jgi:hypothetical protein
MIASSMSKIDVLMEGKLMRLLDLLVNPYVTELNCAVFNKIRLIRTRKFNDFLLVHALKNCPKISRIEFGNKQSLSLDMFRQKIDILAIECFKNSWNNLTSIKCQEDFIVDENALKLIQENFPNIELVFSRDSYKIGAIIHFYYFNREMRIAVTALSPAGVDHLRNMKRLHTLDLLLVEFPKVQQSDLLIPDFIVAVAGEVPSLRNFAFICDYIHNQFIEDFAQKYPQKQLLVNKLRYVECSLNFIVKYFDNTYA